MGSSPIDSQMQALADTLSSVRDSWVMISLALKDYVAQANSPEGELAMKLAQQFLAQVGGGDMGPSA